MCAISSLTGTFAISSPDEFLSRVVVSAVRKAIKYSKYFFYFIALLSVPFNDTTLTVSWLTKWQPVYASPPPRPKGYRSEQMEDLSQVATELAS